MIKRINTIWIFLFFVAVFFIPLSIFAGDNPQSLLKQYISDLQKNPSDYALREKIIRHVQTMRPKPAVPDEALKYMDRGLAAIEGGKGEEDFRAASVEFTKAASLAPWLGDAYRNLAIAQDKSGQFDAALKNLRLYLLTSPSHADEAWAKSLINKVEYRKEKAAGASKQQATAEKKQLTDEELIRKINGARYTHSFRDEKFGSGGESTIDVQGNVAIYGLIITWTRDGKPIQGFPFGVWGKTGRDGFVRGRQIIIPEQSWSYRNGSWFPHEPMICAIGENGSTLSCNQTIQSGSQLTTTYRQQR